MILRTIISIISLAALGYWLINDHNQRSRGNDLKTFTCQDCRRAADQVITKLSAASTVQTDQLSGPGRRLNLPLSEDQIVDSLDSACDAFTSLDKHGSCQRQLSPFRAALEESLFQQEEYKKYDITMCSDILNLCDPHEVTSPGEL
ncbi:hypothetical protein Ndes2526B_g04669 [Nannochloris sp. 'desiccata']